MIETSPSLQGGLLVGAGWVVEPRPLVGAGICPIFDPVWTRDGERLTSRMCRG